MKQNENKNKILLTSITNIPESKNVNMQFSWWFR